MKIWNALGVIFVAFPTGLGKLSKYKKLQEALHRRHRVGGKTRSWFPEEHIFNIYDIKILRH